MTYQYKYFSIGMQDYELIVPCGGTEYFINRVDGIQNELVAKGRLPYSMTQSKWDDFDLNSFLHNFIK